MEKKQSCTRIFADHVQIKACKKRLAEIRSFNHVSNLLMLAGNEVRLKIIFLLEEEKELCPCDLADILEMSIPAVSQHLRKMKDGNIIDSRRSGQTIYYSLNPEHLKLFRPLFKYITDQKTKKELV